MKTEAINWKAFMDGQIVVERPARIDRDLILAAAAAGVLVATIPNPVLAANGWSGMQSDVLEVADWLARGIIIFGGGIWMFGNRTKALELLIGMCCGYEVIRHHEDILNWLKSI